MSTTSFTTHCSPTIPTERLLLHLEPMRHPFSGGAVRLRFCDAFEGLLRESPGSPEGTALASTRQVLRDMGEYVTYGKQGTF